MAEKAERSARDTLLTEDSVRERQNALGLTLVFMALRKNPISKEPPPISRLPAAKRAAASLIRQTSTVQFHDQRFWLPPDKLARIVI
jgi:hypothetical protein